MFLLLFGRKAEIAEGVRCGFELFVFFFYYFISIIILFFLSFLLLLFDVKRHANVRFEKKIDVHVTNACYPSVGNSRDTTLAETSISKYWSRTFRFFFLLVNITSRVPLAFR